MKTSILTCHRGFVLRIMLSLFLSLAIVACDEDQSSGVDELETGDIAVTGIIVNPKSPQPGDTIQVTVIITGAPNVGSFPTIAWSSVGGVGQFLDNNQLSARWVAPSSSGIVNLSVRATGPTNTSSRDVNIFVGSSQTVVGSGAAEMAMEPSGTSFYYLTSPASPDDPGFNGFQIGHFDGANSRIVFNSQSPRGVQNVFSPDLEWVAHSRSGPVGAANVNDPVNIFADDLNLETTTQLTSDTRLPHPVELRHDEYASPAFSPNSHLLTFGAFKPDQILGAPDSFDVYVHNVQTQQTINVTRSQGNQRSNFYPSFSTDGNWLVYIGDASGADVWELFAQPVTGDLVDSSLASRVQLTDTGGLITGGSAGPFLTNPLKAWNPLQPILALKAADGTVLLIEIVGGTGTVNQVFGITGNTRELVWSNEGQTLAISDGSILYTVGAGGGTATVRHTVGNDQVRDMTWAPGNEFMLFRIIRGSDSWFELFDIDAGRFDEPVVVTSTVKKGELDTYRGFLATAPVINAAGEAFIIQFDGPGGPRIDKLDISGVLN